jgi:hypothetical protein
MPCLVALIVFGIMGIFSASQRKLAKEALICVFRRVSFRPCQTGFQEKVKGKLVTKLLQRSAFWAKILNKYYEIFSWIFFLIFLGSIVWLGWGGYNFYVYGSCNGLNSTSFCAFDPSGANNKITELNMEAGDSCNVAPKTEKNIILQNADLSSFPAKNVGGENTVIFIGCYDCDYSRKAYPDIQKLVNQKKSNYIFAHYPAKGHITDHLANAVYCVYKNYGDRFWDFNDYLFVAEEDYILEPANMGSILRQFGFDLEKCISSPTTKEAVAGQVEELDKTGLYGTPTVFINGQAFVGPKPYRVYRSAINKFIFF